MSQNGRCWKLRKLRGKTLYDLRKMEEEAYYNLRLYFLLKIEQKKIAEKQPIDLVWYRDPDDLQEFIKNYGSRKKAIKEGFKFYYAQWSLLNAAISRTEVYYQSICEQYDDNTIFNDSLVRGDVLCTLRQQEALNLKTKPYNNNRVHWHEIWKDPTDVPESNCTERVLGCDRSGITLEVYWYRGHWYDDYFEGKEVYDLENGTINEIDEDIIAWAEIPTYRKFNEYKHSKEN